MGTDRKLRNLKKGVVITGSNTKKKWFRKNLLILKYSYHTLAHILSDFGITTQVILVFFYLQLQCSASNQTWLGICGPNSHILETGNTEINE